MMLFVTGADMKEEDFESDLEGCFLEIISHPAAGFYAVTHRQEGTSLFVPSLC